MKLFERQLAIPQCQKAYQWLPQTCQEGAHLGQLEIGTREPFGVIEVSYIWVESWLYRSKHLLKPIYLYTQNAFIDCKLYLDKVFLKTTLLIVGQCVTILPPDELQCKMHSITFGVFKTIKAKSNQALRSMLFHTTATSYVWLFKYKLMNTN